MSVMRIDWDNLRLTLQPYALRSAGVLQGLVAAMLAPVKRAYGAYCRYEVKEEAERSYDCRVKMLRKAVAGRLGISESGVAIGDVANRDYMDLRRESDGQGNIVSVGQAALWSEEMVAWNRAFTVTLPKAYEANEAEVRAVLERYKMAASRYDIIYV